MTQLILEWPARLFRSFTVQASLPLYELDRTNVQTPRSKIRPFDPARGFTKDPLCPKTEESPEVLRLSGWRLAHAVKKADCLRRMPYELTACLGFLLEQMPILDWRRGNLRLLAGAANAHADFSGSSLAGRIGQGVALLFMETRGYAFSAHYPRPARESGPDFIFEDETASTSRALVEAKGAFVAPGARAPGIKGDLREGLAQIAAARTFGAAKSFAVATLLREAGDAGKEPSLVAFVDPEDTGHTPFGGLESDWIRRHNYAAWLDAMGLHYAASDLRARTPRDRPEPRRVWIVTVNGEEFGVIILQLLHVDDLDFFLHHPGPWHDGRCVIAGLPMAILRAIEAALDDPTSLLEPRAEGLTPPHQSAPALDGGFKGSILTDGSLIGIMPARDLLRGNTQEMLL